MPQNDLIGDLAASSRSPGEKSPNQRPPTIANHHGIPVQMMNVFPLVRSPRKKRSPWRG
jgi:hypothetical protein